MASARQHGLDCRRARAGHPSIVTPFPSAARRLYAVLSVKGRERTTIATCPAGFVCRTGTFCRSGQQRRS